MAKQTEQTEQTGLISVTVKNPFYFEGRHRIVGEEMNMNQADYESLSYYAEIKPEKEKK
jgi:hypothetical protein